ncbi:phosphotransferase family protein [Nonomuraea sp. H19]|uniref:phosphotransferase family protein n=1 Tax=Nonomuraea sp. H19 TaxID=3452206 RepID=UPI003F8BFBCE
MTRPQWEELPEVVRDAVQTECGPVLKTESAASGIMPGLAACLHTEDGTRVFLKAIPTSHPAEALHVREQWAAHALPAEVPAPPLLWSTTLKGWHVMMFEYVNDSAHEADLSPGSPDLQPVLDTLALLGDLLTPCPGGAEPVAVHIAPLQAKGRRLLNNDSLDLADRYLYGRALDRFHMRPLFGKTLLHYDLSAGNLLVTGTGIKVVDWAFAVSGAAWVEAAMFAPRLVQAGHTPEQVDRFLSTVPAWQAASNDAVTGLAALWTLFRIYKAKYGPNEHRRARAEAAAAGRAWLNYRMNTA